MPAFPITVPQSLYDAVAEVCGEPYADSYLWGAEVRGMKLIPWTVTGWMRLRERWAARGAIETLGYELIKPAPWGSPGGSKLDPREAMPHLFLDEKPKRRRPDYEAW